MAPTSALVPIQEKILIGICSCRHYAAKRAAVRETWMSDFPPYILPVFFVGEGEGDVEEDVMVVQDLPDDYAHLPAKVRGFFRQALETYDFDWLFKCDDDTYVATERLADLTRTGFEHVGDGDWMPGRHAASGGAGYLLSRRLVEILAADESLADTGAEDLIISGAAVNLCEGRYLATRRLSYHAKRYPRRDNDLITSHWLSPERMRAIHTLYKEEPWHTMTVRHPVWQDLLVFHENGVFSRTSCLDSGHWDLIGDDTVLLRWFDFPHEEIKIHPVANGPSRVIVRLQGGLGNQLFQFAAGMTVARVFGLELELAWLAVSRHFQLGRFGISLGTEPEDEGKRVFQLENYRNGVEDQILGVARTMAGGIFVLDGHFQNERLFLPAADEVAGIVLKALTPRPPVDLQGRTPVGVHVRRGDFVGHPDHEVCTVGYYLRAIDWMRRRVRLPLFVIVSDDPAWCRIHLATSPDVRIEEPADTFRDFEKLLGCEAHILSNSTFGWWAAWLAEKSPHRPGRLPSHPVAAPDRFIHRLDWNILPDRWHRIPTAPEVASP